MAIADVNNMPVPLRAGPSAGGRKLRCGSDWWHRYCARRPEGQCVWVSRAHPFREVSK
jgi:hypothetical protein